MTQTKTDLYVNTTAAAEDALEYARTAMLPAFSITCDPPLLRLQELMGNIYGKESGSFSTAQLRSYTSSFRMYPLARRTRLDATADHFTPAKDTNDLICVAAEIGAKLKAHLGERPTLQRIIHVYQKWINATFHYQRTGQAEDHSAIALMRSRTGVCQAIAALTVLVLPHLGLLTRYVSGQGGGREGLAPHAWNVIRVPAPGCDPALEEQLQWYHVDFTFGMNRPTPNTLTPRSTLAFSLTHAWDTERFTNAFFNACCRRENTLRSAAIVLQENSCRWQLGNIILKSPRPVLKGSEQQGHWIDLFTLLRFLGGGCEYLAGENRLRVCLQDRQYLIENGSYYLGSSGGYLKISILRHLPLQISRTQNGLSAKVVIP